MKVRNIILMGVVTGHAYAGPILDSIVSGKKELTAQVANLRSSGNQLLTSGAQLQNILLYQIEGAQKGIAAGKEALKVPYAVLFDPLKEAQEKAANDPNLASFLEFLRSPSFRDAYANLWRGILQPLGISSMQDVLQNLSILLNTLETTLQPIPGLFKPIVGALDACVVVDENNRNNMTAMQAVNLDYVIQNRAQVDAACQQKFQRSFDTMGIYAGLASALQDLDSALNELNKLETIVGRLQL